MEKTVVFGPLIIFFAIFALLIFLFLRFIFRLVAKSKNEDWYGEVIDKKINEIEDDDTGITHDYCYLIVTMDDGKERKVGLSRQLWEKFQTGDKLHKPKGKLFPEKI
ncbi:MAG: hypothetical protein WC503_05690 [Candidatus Shapirobacteria bacterium]